MARRKTVKSAIAIFICRNFDWLIGVDHIIVKSLPAKNFKETFAPDMTGLPKLVCDHLSWHTKCILIALILGKMLRLKDIIHTMILP